MRLACILLGVQTCVALAASWTNVSTGLTGPVAAVRTLLLDGTGSTLYAAGNGVFTSTDGGASWQMIGGVAGVQVLALDPTSASTIYAGTTRGVFGSTDGGQSWSSAGLAGMAINTLAVDPITPSTLYAGAFDAYVYKSTDAGQNWTSFAVGLPAGPQPAGPQPGVNAIIVDPATPSTLYVVPGGPVGAPLYKSTDGAETWSVIYPGPVVRFLAITPSTLYALIAPLRGLAKSTDGGASWTAMGLSQDVFSFAIDPGNPDILYAGTTAPFGSPTVLYKTTDGGQSWNAANASLPLAQSLLVESSVIYAATSSGVFQSSDGGTTWSASNNGLSTPNIQVVVADPADAATIYAGGDGGLFKSVDGGGSWSRQATFMAAGVPPPGLPPLPPGLTPVPEAASVRSMLIDITNPNILYVGTHRPDGCFAPDVLLYKSTDGGANWSDSINPNEGFGSGCLADALVGMDPSDPNTIYLRWGDDYDGFSLRKSTDGGSSWSFTKLGANELYGLVIDPTSPQTLYAGTDSGVVKSTDGGASWNVVGLAMTNVNLLAIDPLRPEVLYAATTAVYPDTYGFIGLLRSADRGASWTPINNGLDALLNSRATVNAIAVDPKQTNVLYLATTGFGVFRSSDSGASWAPYNDGLSFLDVRALTISAAAMYAGTPGGVFRIFSAPL